MEQSGGGKATMDALRAKVADLAGVEQALLTQRSAEQEQAFSNARLALGIGTGASALLALLAGLALARGIASPLSRLAGGVKRIADGDLTIEVEGATRGDEVGRWRGRCWC